MSSQEISTLSSTKHPYDNDVFLSFRGEDTRHNFTAHLYKALCRKGIFTFIDDQLKRGEEIAPALLKAIERSKISIVIFSKDYASSAWCLDELAKIMECRESRGQVVLPVFYHVEPSQVRKQTGSYGKSMVKHEVGFKDNLVKLEKWKKALKDAGNLSGYTVGTRTTKNEATLIEKIIEDVSRKLDRTLHVADYPVEIDTRVQQLKSHVNTVSEDVHMVGIWGIGGVGKTTLAKALFNDIPDQFEGRSFLANIREASKQFCGLSLLQKRLLSHILGDRDWGFENHDQGINILRQSLCSKRILLVLDDVDREEQLKALAGGKDWFGPGSMIIITSRDLHIIKGCEFSYRVEGLSNESALQLFSWHAFKKDYPDEDFVELSHHAVDYAKGLPLVLVVLGAFLCGKSKPAWESEFSRLKATFSLDKSVAIVDDDVLKVLRISFDELRDNEKAIFLDIACFFVGENKEYVESFLQASGFLSKIGIEVLVQRSLLTIEFDKLWMHDLIRDMGREIVRKESPKLGERSRIWNYKEARHVMEKNKGTYAVEGIKMVSFQPAWLCMEARAFKDMERLRFLQIANIYIHTDIAYLPDELRWIEWPRYPLSSLPYTFDPHELVRLSLQFSSVKQLWRGTKNLNNLKYLDLSCSELIEIPDLSKAPNIEYLNLFECTNLVEVHKSVGFLPRLVHLDLSGCSNLKKLPCSIRLRSLQNFYLTRCTKLEVFPEIEEDMRCLRHISLRNTALKELPSSIENLVGLEVLDLRSCENLESLPSSLCSLRDLKELLLDGCHNLGRLPSSLKFRSLLILSLSSCYRIREFLELSPDMKFLKKLSLGGTSIQQLQSSIGQLSELEVLDLTNCESLETLPWSICMLQKLKRLCLEGCSNLRALPNCLSLRSLQFLSMVGCSKVEEFPKIVSDMMVLREMYLRGTAIRELSSSIGDLRGLEKLDLNNCKKLVSLPSSIYSLFKLEQLNLEGCSEFATLPMFVDVGQDYCTSTSSMIEGTSSSSELGSTTSLPEISGTSKFLHDPRWRLKVLNLARCNIDQTEFLGFLPYSWSLVRLNLPENNIVSIPSCISDFHCLEVLNVSGCKFLREIQRLPRSIREVNIHGCESLVQIDAALNSETTAESKRQLNKMVSAARWDFRKASATGINISVPADAHKRLKDAVACFHLDAIGRKTTVELSCQLVDGNELCFLPMESHAWGETLVMRVKCVPCGDGLPQLADFKVFFTDFGVVSINNYLNIPPGEYEGKVDCAANVTDMETSTEKEEENVRGKRDYRNGDTEEAKIKTKVPRHG